MRASKARRALAELARCKALAILRAKAGAPRIGAYATLNFNRESKDSSVLAVDAALPASLVKNHSKSTFA